MWGKYLVSGVASLSGRSLGSLAPATGMNPVPRYQVKLDTPRGYTLAAPG
jgi:hypothetical protein